MRKYRLSIIIPVYNAEEHIEKCMDSVIRQATDEDEILLIDDGSRDKSEKIIRKYEKNYPHIVRVISKKNEGVAKTRNLGIKEARGEYICFVDNDDYIDDDYISAFCNAIKYGYDIVIGGYRRIALNRIQFQVKPKDSNWYKYIMMAPWAKIYRKDFLIKNEIEFLDYGLGEDVYFSIVAYSCTNKIKVIDYIGYNWYFNTKSVSNTSQKGFNIKLDPTYLLESIYKRVGKEKEEYTFFYIRYGIWYLLFSGKNAKKQAFMQEYSNLFSWYKMNDIKVRFPILKGKTRGEKISVKLIVKGFIIIHKLKMVKLFADFYCKG